MLTQFTNHKTYGDSYKKLKAVQLMGLPYGPDLPTITDEHEAGSLFYLTTDELVYKCNGLIWDSNWGAATGPNGETRVVSGTATWSGVGLVYNGSEFVVKILGQTVPALAQNVTLDPADATFPRRDVLFVDNTGVFGKITGTPSAAPVKPQVDTNTQIEITDVLINAGSLTPSNVTQEVFYDEGSEATNASNIPSINFAYATAPLSGAVSTYAPAFTNGLFFSYQRASTFLATNFGFVMFNVWIPSTYTASTYFSVYLYNGAVPTTNAVNVTSGNYGFTRTVTGVWQSIVIPITAFGLITNTFDKIYIRTNGAHATGFKVDYVRMQTGQSGAGGTNSGVRSFNLRQDHVMPLAGDYTSAMVTEATNLYFTQARVLATVLTGFVTNNAPIAATDTILQAFNKAQGQIDALIGGGSAYLPLAGGALAGFVTVHADPVNANHIANKNYVDNRLVNISWKDEVQMASTGNLALTGLQTIDGRVGVANDRVLAKDQTDPKENGIWVMAAGAWARAADANTSARLFHATVVVGEGTLNGNKHWTNNNTAAPVIGVDNITFAPISTGGGTYTNGTYLSLVGNVFDIDFATFSTSQITEGAKLFFTNARAIAATLTGYSAGAGTVSAADTILQAIQKLDGNIAAMTGRIYPYANLAAFPVTGVGGRLYYDIALDKYHKWNGTTYPEFGAGGGGGGTWGTITGTVASQTDIQDATLQGSYTAVAGTVVLGDTLKQAIQKIDANAAAAAAQVVTAKVGNLLYLSLNAR